MFRTSCAHHQEENCTHSFYGMLFMHLCKQFSRWQAVLNTFMLLYSHVFSWLILTHNTKNVPYMCPAVHDTDLNLLFSLQSCIFHVRYRRWLQWTLSVRSRIKCTLVCRSMSFSTCRFIYTLLMFHVTKRMQITHNMIGIHG
jgi:hypothetical protein